MTTKDHEFRKTGHFRKEEMNAIVEGLQLFGIGTWSTLLQDNDYAALKEGIWYGQSSNRTLNKNM
jgi:hypothetical protein